MNIMSILGFTTISPRFIRVWQRNLTVYRRIWKISFIPPLLEPLFYLLAFGVGLSALVGTVAYRGEAISYISFLAPALIAVAIMYNAFFETTYSSFVRMYYQKTYDAMMATPLALQEIIAGEIAWGATKSLIATTIMLAVLTAFGLIHYPHGLLLIPLSVVGGIAFGAVGMYFTAIVPHIETFNLPIFLFITPMFLFSGTFFPLDTLPGWARMVAWTLPLTHLVAVTRALCFGQFSPHLVWHMLYLFALACIGVPVAIHKMRCRLIK